MENEVFFNISLLITHYNRSSSLERLLHVLKFQDVTFAKIIVSDDGSEAEHLKRLQELNNEFSFQLITTKKNMGLGNNINKGQKAIKSTYTLYVQEDFVPLPCFKDALKNAESLLDSRPDLDIARFYAYFKYPYLKPFKNGFSEMTFTPNIIYFNYRKFYMYSDHPHLRRSNFLEKFGNYPEGIKGDATEYRMMMNFLQQKGKGIFYEDFKGLFDQVNSETEPSTMKRNSLRNSDNFLIEAIRNLYRHMKFNFDYHFSK